MLTFFAFLATLVTFTGRALDYYLPEQKKRVFLDACAAASQRLERVGSDSLIRNESEVAISYLKAIFGEKAISTRRFVRVMIFYMVLVCISYAVIEVGGIASGRKLELPFGDCHYQTGFPYHYIGIYISVQFSIVITSVLTRLVRVRYVGILIFAIIHCALFFVSSILSIFLMSEVYAESQEFARSILYAGLFSALSLDAMVNYYLNGIIAYFDRFVQLVLSGTLHDFNIYNTISSDKLTLAELLAKFLLFPFHIASNLDHIVNLIKLRFLLAEEAFHASLWHQDLGEQNSSLVQVLDEHFLTAAVSAELYDVLLAWYVPGVRFFVSILYIYSWFSLRFLAKVAAISLEDFARRGGPVFSILLGFFGVAIAAVVMLVKFTGFA